MDDSEIVRYMKMSSDELTSLLAEENPPVEAVRAAAVLDFMEAFHLRDTSDGLQQFIRLRKAQARQLGLEGEEIERFMDGFAPPGEYSPKKGV